jgi:hypothetical protein
MSICWGQINSAFYATRFYMNIKHKRHNVDKAGLIFTHIFVITPVLYIFLKQT